MGRGRGRGGRGHGRGRFGGSKGSRTRVPVSRKEASHLKQFGEKHPADEMRDFSASAKRFKSDHFQSTAGRLFSKKDDSSTDSDSEEEEATPYNELLSIFTGEKGKKPVQIVSESEEESHDSAESETEDLDVEPMGTVAKEIKDITSSTSDSNEEGEEAEENKDLLNGSTVGLVNPEEDSDEEVTFVEETVIDEAELDPEAYDDTDYSESKTLDPFIAHFERELSTEMQLVLSGNKPFEKQENYEWPILEKVKYIAMQMKNNEKEDFVQHTQPLFLHSGSKLIKSPPKCPPQEPGDPTLHSLHIKSQIHSTIPIANRDCIERTNSHAPLTPLQKELLSLITNYHDLYFPNRTSQNEEEVRMAYCIHAANHILKTRTRIVHHNAKMVNKVDVPEEYRDQGFVRPKVLILTPFKETALRIVKTLISIVLEDEKGSVEKKKRFVDEYSGETLFLPKTNPKPDDYMALFSGNVDDNFKIGLAVTKKSIKLYTGFYTSDIIVASPLGLRMIIGAQGEKDRDFDFLSSIEVFIMDQADVFLMQNWDHLLHLVRHLHLQPVTTHETNFARIRPWALDNLTKFYCQTLLFSSIITPEHLAFFSRYARNFAGFVKIINPILSSHISQITVQLPQVFQQFDCESVADVNDLRFEHFLKKVLPNFKGKLMSHTLIFVSSYFDFVRLRNYFRKEEESFVQICEYTKDMKIARARDLFFHGKNKFLLYTERAHFFRRFRLKGIGHIIFYQLPQYPHFYAEICNLVQEGFQNRRVRLRKNSSVNVMYCKYDATRLASLVGTERANYMLSSEKPTHAFITESF